MSTPCTIARVVRWRVKDWASCFYACKFPLDEEPDTFCCSSTQTNYTTMVFNPLDDNRRSETKKTASFDNKCKEEKEESVESHGTQTIDDTAVRSTEKQTTDDSSWPRFAEEDYIVFCFQEDGAIHMLKDRKSEVSNHHIDRSSESSRLLSRKLIYGENEEKVVNPSHEDMLNEDEKEIYPTTDGDSNSVKKGDENEERLHMDTQLAADGIKEVNHIEEIKECKMVSATSSDSNQSDGSTSSFAFPVLGLEWIDSPEQMPKPDDLHSRKHKARIVRLQCCKF